MLADVLESVLEKSKKSGCVVSVWLRTQDAKIVEVFKKAAKNKDVACSLFYEAIREDYVQRGEDPPFGITALRTHLRNRCACSRTGELNG